MYKVLSSFSKHKTLLISLGVVFLYSATLTFATTYVSPGTILDPLGVPGSYAVTPPLTYGGAVTSGHDGEVLYIDGSGNLVSDDIFTRNSSNGDTIIGKHIDANNDISLFIGDAGSPIGQIAALQKENTLNNTQAFVGAIDGTFATFSDVVAMMIATDEDTGVYAASVADPIGRAMLYSSNATSNLASFEANGGSGFVQVRNFDTVGQYSSEINLGENGNDITWDADTTDDVTSLIAQSEDLGSLGIKGNLVVHKDTVTGEAANILVGDTTAVGGRFASISLSSADNSAADTLANITLSHNDGVYIQYDETILSDRISNITLNTNGLGISYNSDITDDIIDQIQMTTDVGGFGVLDGIGILRTDSNLGINTGLFVGDASGLGLNTMTSYISASGLLAAVDQDKFSAGDLLAMGNGTMMQVNDSTQKIKFNTGGQFVIVDGADGELLEIDAATFYFQLGDIAAGGNGTLFTIDDSNQIITITAAGSSNAVFAVTNTDGTCTLDPGDVSGLACPSDMNLKKEITQLQDGALKNILALRPVTYRLNTESDTVPLSTGLIAQEVQSIFPTLVKTQMNGTLSLNYGGLTPFLIKAIQELDLKIKELVVPQSGNSSIIDQFVDMVLRIRGLVVGTPERRTGITLYDEITGEPYCISVAGGAPKTVSGECVEIVPINNNTPEPAPELIPEPTPEDPPVEEPPAPSE